MAAAAQSKTAQPSISSDEAHRVARLDAERVFRDGLDHYRIEITRQPDGWHVDYLLNRPGWNGGGAQYVIDPVTGQITAKRYEQ